MTSNSAMVDLRRFHVKQSSRSLADAEFGKYSVEHVLSGRGSHDISEVIEPTHDVDGYDIGRLADPQCLRGSPCRMCREFERIALTLAQHRDASARRGFSQPLFDNSSGEQIQPAAIHERAANARRQ